MKKGLFQERFLRSIDSREVHGGGEEEVFPWKPRGAVGGNVRPWELLIFIVSGAFPSAGTQRW